MPVNPDPPLASTGRSPRWLTPDWPAPANVRALSTLRGGGASAAPYASLNLGSHVGDAAAAVAENRRALRVAAGLPGEPVWLEQVHGNCVLDLDHRRDAGSPQLPGPADAAVTGSAQGVCAVLTADCLPILLTSVAGDRVGAAHAGWRGLAAGVIEATVRALGVPPGELLAWLGPAIGPRHFEVGGEVRDALLNCSGDVAAGDTAARDAAAFVLNARGRYLADLPALARNRLERLGVQRVYGGDRCTYAEGDQFFSHRRDGTTGRMASLIWLERSPSG